MNRLLIFVVCVIFSFSGCGEVTINSHDDIIKLFMILQNKRITRVTRDKLLIDYKYSIVGFAKDKSNYGYFLSWEKEPRKGTLAELSVKNDQGTVTYVIPIKLGDRYFSKNDLTAKIIQHDDKYYLKSSDHIESNKLLMIRENADYIIETTGSFNGMYTFNLYQVMYGSVGVEIKSVKAESVQNITDTEIYTRKLID
jgi:hypothetical protein